jgi:two-component system chemotaxis sensor kinase CheA
MSERDVYRETFINEAQDLTEALEADLVELEEKHDDDELINRIFRAAHTMKSSAAMFGFPQIANLTHSMEGVLDRVRDGLLAIDAEMVSLLLDSLDVLRRMVDEATDGTESDHSASLSPLCERLRVVAASDGPVGQQPSPAGESGGDDVVAPPAEELREYQIHIGLNPDVFFRGANPMLLLDELATLGEVTEVRCDLSRLPSLEEIDPVQLYLAWDVVLRSSRTKNEIEDVFLFHLDDGDIRVDVALPDGEDVATTSAPNGTPDQSQSDLAPHAPAGPMPSSPVTASSTPITACDASREHGTETTQDGIGEPERSSTDGRRAMGDTALPAITGLDGLSSVTPEDAEILRDFCNETSDSLQEVEEKILALEEDPTDLEIIHALFRTFHSMKGSAGFLELSALGGLAHETENLLDRARNGELLLDGVSIGLLLHSIDLARGLNANLASFLDGGCQGEPADVQRLPVERQVTAIKEFLARSIPHPPAAGAPIQTPTPVSTPKQIGELLVEKGHAEPKDIGDAIAAQLSGTDEPLGRILVDKGKVEPNQVNEALKTQFVQRRETATQKTVSAIRVDTERLDTLMNLVGEIVIAQSQAMKISTGFDDEQGERLQASLYEVERLSRELQDQVMAVRMMPIGPTFKQFARFVRDTTRELGKQVNFVITGEDTELDKTVIEQIGDPLKHLIRNSLDHGLETPADRRAAGKPEKGTLELRAGHHGGSVVIEVIDDGRGISRATVLSKAIAKGLVTEDQELPDNQILRLIFHPGFTTAEQVSSLSGRGVGMDVVKRNVESLRGSVDVESEEGNGSVLRIRLPLTLAIIEGMVVSVSGQPYILPVLSIVESIRPRAQDIRHVSGQGEVLFFRNEYLPLYRLYEWLEHEPVVSDPTQGIVLVVEDGAGRRALMADDLLGQQQVVIKNLEDNFTKLDGISGATILADGNVALILDIVGLYYHRQAAKEIVA